MNSNNFKKALAVAGAVGAGYTLYRVYKGEKVRLLAIASAILSIILLVEDE